MSDSNAEEEALFVDSLELEVEAELSSATQKRRLRSDSRDISVDKVRKVTEDNSNASGDYKLYAINLSPHL